jgi:hypothetical protein
MKQVQKTENRRTGQPNDAKNWSGQTAGDRVRERGNKLKAVSLTQVELFLKLVCTHCVWALSTVHMFLIKTAKFRGLVSLPSSEDI